MNFDVFEYSNKGGRDYNEDSAGFKYSGDKGIFVVADGLGGHLCGEEASSLAVETIIESWQENYDMTAQLTDGIKTANMKILELQKIKGKTMKTTVAVLEVNGRKAVWANVGDSRVYFFHQNRLTAYTDDHSVAYKKYKAGEITREDLATDEDQSSLLRTLGSTERNEPSIYTADVPVSSGDAFLLCSDGVWEYVRDEEMLIDFLKSKNSKQWAELMLLRIMERIDGTNDNLTLMTVIID